MAGGHQGGQLHAAPGQVLGHADVAAVAGEVDVNPAPESPRPKRFSYQSLRRHGVSGRHIPGSQFGLRY